MWRFDWSHHIYLFVRFEIDITLLLFNYMEYIMLCYNAIVFKGLEQGYVVCPSEKRLLVLFTFLKKNRKRKVMVFFSSCMAVKYHHELFNYIDIPVMCIHVSKYRIEQKLKFSNRKYFRFLCYVPWRFFTLCLLGKTKTN